LLTLSNLDATARPSDFYERITGGNKAIRAHTLQTLRQLLPRTPWFAGPYQAVGLDPSGGRVALLGRDAMTVLTLPAGDRLQNDPQVAVYELPVRRGRMVTLRPAAGFLSGLGPAAFVDGYLYVWDQRGERQGCDLWPNLPSSITLGGWMRAEFVAGRLQVSTVERRQEVAKARMLRLDASQLAVCPDTVLQVEPLRLPDRAPSRPLPVFSDAPDQPQRFDYLEENAGPAPSKLAANLPVDPSRADPHNLVELDAIIGSADRQTVPNRIAVGQVAPERGVPERLHYTLALPANAEAAVLKFDGSDFMYTT
jgi:hypothetical protein